MNHWAFVVAAYAVVLVGTTSLIGWAYVTMRKAEAAADGLKRPQ